MKITVEVRVNFGSVMYYPHCDTAKIFAAITGKATLTRNALANISKLGYAVYTVGSPSVRLF